MKEQINQVKEEMGRLGYSIVRQGLDIELLTKIQNKLDKIKGRLGYYVRVPKTIEEFRVKSEDRLYKWPLRY